MTFGRWLDENEDQLVDGLWICTVSGHLDFEQDLVYSKLVDIEDIAKAARSQEQEVQKGMRQGGYEATVEDTNIPSDFVMLRRQVVNGVITADVLRVLRQTATRQEWGRIRNLEVVTAAAYLARDRKANVREWCQAVMAHEGEYASEPVAGGGTEIKDGRSRAWYGIPLEHFIGRLVDERKGWKDRAKDESLTDDERSHAKGMDELLKLVVNCYYGVIASRHFRIGNTIVGNNITARARVGVWMVAKALGLRQCITDGGIYDPARVSFFYYADGLGSKPGLATLSRMDEWDDPRRCRRLAPMARVDDWRARIQGGDLPDDLDQLAMRHVAEFWRPYDLCLPFELEHKRENTFLRAAYWSKADYALVLLDGKIRYRLRGKDKDKKNHPTFAILDAILAGEDDFPSGDALLYTRKGLLKIGKFRIIQQSAGYENARHLRPGDDMPEEIHPARYNNTWMRLRDEQDYLRRKTRKKSHRGELVRWFEKHAGRGISGVHTRMEQNRL